MNTFPYNNIPKINFSNIHNRRNSNETSPDRNNQKMSPFFTKSKNVEEKRHLTRLLALPVKTSTERENEDNKVDKEKVKN